MGHEEDPMQDQGHRKSHTGSEPDTSNIIATIEANTRTTHKLLLEFQAARVEAECPPTGWRVVFSVLAAFGGFIIATISVSYNILSYRITQRAMDAANQASTAANALGMWTLCFSMAATLQVSSTPLLNSTAMSDFQLPMTGHTFDLDICLSDVADRYSGMTPNGYQYYARNWTGLQNLVLPDTMPWSLSGLWALTLLPLIFLTFVPLGIAALKYFLTSQAGRKDRLRQVEKIRQRLGLSTDE